MNHKATLANQISRLLTKLEKLHDLCNETKGSANPMTMELMHMYAICYACSVDLEYIMDEGHSDEDN